MIPKEVSSKILDDAGGDMALLFCKWCPHDCREFTREEKIGCLAAGGFVDELKALSGTTDIECPECYQGQVPDALKINKPYTRKCPECDGTGVIKHKWKVSVTLENGKLPEYNSAFADKLLDDAALLGFQKAQHYMLNAKYRQVVE